VCIRRYLFDIAILVHGYEKDKIYQQDRVYIRIYIYTCIYIYVCVCVYIYMCVYICECVCVHTHTHAVTVSYVISGFRRGVNEILALLGCYVAFIGS
jgi:hypothetical protein